MKTELLVRLREIAERVVSLKGACSNEESTKLYLVMPFIGTLGYDFTDPHEVYPEHNADFSQEYPDKVDLVILKDGVPTIAFEVKKAGAPIIDHRGQLARYFNAVPSIRVGVITNGIIYAFYVDSDAPNMMDDDPFLIVDLEKVALGNHDVETLDAIEALTKPVFNPEFISEQAQQKLLKRRLRTFFVEEARAPSQDFCRFALERVGLKYLRSHTIDKHYAPLVVSAFEESLIEPVVRILRERSALEQPDEAEGKASAGSRIVTTERELSIFAFVRRRLSFLVSNERYFDAIERIQYRDYIGHFTVYYEQIKKGRIFDFIEGANGYDRYTFPDPFGEIITSNPRDLDKALLSVFMSRVSELGSQDASVNASTNSRTNRSA
ncbi:MAG: hypothetical protein KDJ47_06355 [Hyphomicrobiaceae bacterium]|nr:hypothetical protein [Hyphomicrobiaceae bacterium]